MWPKVTGIRWWCITSRFFFPTWRKKQSNVSIVIELWLLMTSQCQPKGNQSHLDKAINRWLFSDCYMNLADMYRIFLIFKFTRTLSKHYVEAECGNKCWIIIFWRLCCIYMVYMRKMNNTQYHWFKFPQNIIPCLDHALKSYCFYNTLCIVT